MSLTHTNADGAMHMVDVGAKPPSKRLAVAQAQVTASPQALAHLAEGTAEKGDVLAAVRLAGIQGAKRTADWIPLCHPLALTHVAVDISVEPQHGRVSITTRAETTAPTGVEMEALTAASAAALTLYDMLKAVDRSMTIQHIHLLRKEGGRAGVWTREDAAASTAT